MAILRYVTRRLFIVLNLISAFLFLLACANTFLHPGRWWIIALLGLIFPLLLLLLVCFFIIGLFVPGWRRWSLLSLAVLVIGWPNIHNFLALHPGHRFDPRKPAGALRIMTWNVRSFDEFTTRKMGASGHRSQMMDFIDSQHADVLCLEEFFESRIPSDSCSIPYMQERLHFPYYVFSRDYVHFSGKYRAGVIIFSRYPIVDSQLVHVSRPDGYRTTESLIAADIHAGKDTIRVFATHLQSVLFQSKDFHDLEIIRKVDDSILTASKSIAKKLGYAFRRRADQAEQVRAQLDKSPHPGIICGDFNDVPNSFTYATIRGKWQDAFLKKGFGIGRTYVHISPTLRIDYILTSPVFNVLQCRTFFSLHMSDHNPVVTDVKLGN
ncbi:MAG TPA: endonuclease/exonuclease/phosphatase family protein [Puia sp.]|jgi:endonuclease/exonuclease/phosphatase family metal-dependent hydrolase|nr:endonuclease/exonuclease/phosphatase family protein [Puia sp.]